MDTCGSLTVGITDKRDTMHTYVRIISHRYMGHHVCENCFTQMHEATSSLALTRISVTQCIFTYTGMRNESI